MKRILDAMLVAFVFVGGIACGDDDDADPTGSTAGGNGGGGQGAGGLGTTGPGTGGGGGAGGIGGAGGGELEALPTFRSGTRLRAIKRTAGMGSEALVAFRDTVLAMDCNFTELPSGQLYCTADTRVVATRFSDPGCSVPLHECLGCDVAPAVGAHVTVVPSSLESHPCPERGHRRGTPATVAAVIGSGETIYVGTPGSCASVFPSEVTLRVEPVTESTLVSATVQTLAVDGELATRHYLAEDGAAALFGAYSLAHDAPCALGVPATDGLCFPGRVATFGSYYANDGCTAPLSLDVPSATCGAAAFALTVSGAPSQRVRSVGAAHTLKVFTGTTSNCGEVDPADIAGMSPFALGPFVVMPEVSRQQLGGATARPIYRATSEGVPLAFTGNWHDTSRDLPCAPRPTATAGERCLNTAFGQPDSPIGSFTAPDCSSGRVMQAGSASANHYVTVFSEPHYVRAHAFGDTVSGNLYVGSPGSCSLFTTVGAGDGYRLVGPEIPLTELPGLEVVTE